MPEKELLINVMFALEGYAGRIERLETALSHERISQQISNLTSTTTAQIDQMTQSIIDHIENLNIVEEIDELTESVVQKLERYDVTSEIGDIKSTVEAIQYAANDISDIKSAMDDVKSAVEEVKSELTSDVSSIKSDVESMRSSIDDVRLCS